MGIDAKCIGGFLWKVTSVSMKFCYTYVKKYPYVASVLLLLFLLFVFLPSVFFFLIYSSPIVVLVTVSIQIYMKINRFKAQNAKTSEEKPSSGVESKPVNAVSRKYEKPLIHKQLSRRRNPKQNIELDRTLNDALNDASISAQSVKAQSGLMGLNEGKSDSEGEDGLATSTTRNVGAVHDDVIGKTAQNVQAVCDDLKGKNSWMEQGECSSQNVQALDQSSSGLLSHDGSIEQPGKFPAGGEAEVESSDGEDDEEEAQPGGDKAVEWTEDDQKNLMDLGDSELERNKRLESLIAKRRARKLFKLAVEKRLMDSGHVSAAVPIPPMFTLKNNLLSGMPNSLEENLPMPGSAPSVLLPGRNPFDLPYDPMEEKPNLMADSFQQEFMAAQQKDLLFCRHESFCLGPSLLSESKQEQHDSSFDPHGNEKKNEEGHRFSRFRSQSYMSSHDQLIDELLFQEDEALSQNMSATDLVELECKVSKTDSEESKDKEEDQKTDKGKTRTKGEAMESVHDMETEDSAKDNSTDRCSVASSEASELSFNSSMPTNIEILEAKVGKFPPRLGDRVQHGLTFQVPNSSSFYESLYEPSPSGVDKPRLGDRLFNTEKGPCHSPGYSIASDLQVEVSEVGSPPFTGDGTASPVDAESLYDGTASPVDAESLYDKDIDKDPEEMWGTPCHLAGVEHNEFRPSEINEVSEADIIGVGFSAIKQDLEDPSLATSKFPEEVTAKDLPPENDQTHSKNINKEVLANVIQVAEEVQKSSQPSDALSSKNHEEAIPLMDSAAQSSHDVHSDQKLEEPLEFPEKSAEVGNVSDNVSDQVVQANDDKAKLESIADIDGSAEILINQEATEDTDNNSDNPAENQTSTDLEKRIEENLTPQTIAEDPGNINEQDDIGCTSETIEGIDKQSITEGGGNQVFDNPTTSPPQPELEAEQIITNSSSSSSPWSVLPANIPVDQIPASSFDQLVHQIDVPRSIVDDIFRNNSLDDESSEGLTQQLQADPADHLTLTSTDLGKSEEPPVKVAEDRSESLITPEVATELSEPDDIIHPKSIDHIKSKSPILPELEASISSEKIANSESDVPETMLKEEETLNSQEQSTREANVDNITNPVVVNEEKLEFVEGSQGQSEIDVDTSEINEDLGEVTTSESLEDRDENNEKLTENEATVVSSLTIDGNESSSICRGSESIINLPKPASSEDNLEIIGDSQDELATVETDSGKEKLRSAEDNEGKSNVTDNVEDPVNNEKEDLEKLKSGQDSEGEHNNITNNKEDEGGLTENEAAAVPLKSVEGNESLNVIKGSEGVKDLPIPANSESSLEAVEDGQGESEKSENEPAMKLSIPAAGTAEEKESSDSLRQKSEEEVDIIHKMNEAAANEMSSNQNLIQQENAAQVIKSEKIDSNDDDVNKAESTNHSTIEESKPVESEVKASEQETKTAI